jgi:polyisoprenoid-binding protein YceI
VSREPLTGRRTLHLNGRGGRHARGGGFPRGFRRLRGTAVVLPFIVVLGGCGGGDTSTPPSTSDEGKATLRQAGESRAPVAGVRTFVIVPARSQASYHASEEFFPAALARLGIDAGKAVAVGTTQAIEGRFQLDPERPTALLGEHTFTVRVNTLTSSQKKRDDYLRQIRDDGPSFDAYPLAIFRATAIDGTSGTNASGRELNLKLTGDLTVREVTKREVFDVKAQLTGDTLEGVAKTQFLLSDFGIGPIDFPPLLAVADPIGIEIRFTARAEPK